MAWLVHTRCATVAFLRTRLTALAIIAAVLTVAAAPALAAQAHPVCTAKHHGCGQTATLIRCCCGEPGQPSTQSGPVQSPVQVGVDVSAIADPFPIAPATDGAEAIAHPRAFPPGAPPPDLLTLFATLLI